jgi:hypothetical protein
MLLLLLGLGLGVLPVVLLPLPGLLPVPVLPLLLPPPPSPLLPPLLLLLPPPLPASSTGLAYRNLGFSEKRRRASCRAAWMSVVRWLVSFLSRL